MLREGVVDELFIHKAEYIPAMSSMKKKMTSITRRVIIRDERFMVVSCEGGRVKRVRVR